MCRTCGCSANTQQLHFEVKGQEGQTELQTLYDRLLGAPGILSVETDAKTGKVLVDFSSQRTSRQDIESIVREQGYAVLGLEVSELAHQHGITGFVRRIFGK